MHSAQLGGANAGVARVEFIHVGRQQGLSWDCGVISGSARKQTVRKNDIIFFKGKGR